MAKQFTLSWQKQHNLSVQQKRVTLSRQIYVALSKQINYLSSSRRGTETHKLRSPLPRTQSCQMLILSSTPWVGHNIALYTPPAAKNSNFYLLISFKFHFCPPPPSSGFLLLFVCLFWGCCYLLFSRGTTARETDIIISRRTTAREPDVIIFRRTTARETYVIISRGKRNRRQKRKRKTKSRQKWWTQVPVSKKRGTQTGSKTIQNARFCFVLFVVVVFLSESNSESSFICELINILFNQSSKYDQH